MKCIVRAIFSYSLNLKLDEKGQLIGDDFGFSGDVIEGKPKPGMFANIFSKDGKHISLEIREVRYPRIDEGNPSEVEIVLDLGIIQDPEAREFLYSLKIDNQVVSITRRPDV